MYIICSKLTIEKPEQCQCHRSGVFIVNLEQTSHIGLVVPLLTSNEYTPTGIVDFENVIGTFTQQKKNARNHIATEKM